MAVVASQLVAEIQALGAPEAEAQMTALSAANDATAASFATVEAAAASGGTALASVGVEAATDIPSVEALNAQFADMQANLAASFAAIDAESAAMMANAEAAQADAAAQEAFSAALASVGEVAGTVATALGIVALAAGAVAAVIGAVSVKMAGDFQAGITSLETGAGELDKNLGMVSQGILQMAVDTGTSTQQLIAGMYMIESAGFHGAAGLDILHAAAEGARVGEAQLADVANGVTTMMTDYANKNVTAAQATNELIAAVSLGKTHMQDLANSLSTVLPAASSAGIGLRDIMAALATMTAEGTDAASAATYLRQTILALEAPSSAASKMLDSVGLTTQQVASEMKVSLPGALQMITDAIGKKFPPGSAAYIAALKAIVGGTKQLQGILELTGIHLKTFQDNVKGVQGAVDKGKGSIAGWSQVQGDFNTQLARAGEVLQTGLIKLGLQLLPIITPLVKGFADWASNGKAVSKTFADIGQAAAPMMTILAQIGAFLVSTFKPVWDQLVTTFNSQLKPAWEQFVKALGPAMPALKLIGTIILGIVVVALMLFAKTLAMLAQGAILAFGLIVQGISALVSAFLRGLAFATTVVNGIRNLWTTLPGKILTALASLISGLAAFFSNLATQAIQWGKNLIQSFINGILSMLGAVLSAAANIAHQVAKALGFHSPTEYGPGKDADKWAPNLIRMFIAGLRAGMPGVQAAFDALVSPMNRTLGLSVTGSSYRYPAMSGMSSATLQPVIVYATLCVDGREFTNAVIGPHLSQLYITQNAIRQVM